MHVQPIIDGLHASITGHGALAGGDADVEAAVAHLLDTLGPAFRQAAIELAQQAAGEIEAQLGDRTVDVVMVDGDPTLRVNDAPDEPADPANEDFDARITLRLPPRLKHLIEDAAESSGDSVNAFVVDALSKRARRAHAGRGGRVRETFDL